MAWKSTDHMLAGCAAAAASPNTPAHLKPHLLKRTGSVLKRTGNLVPKKSPAMASAKKANPFYGE